MRPFYFRRDSWLFSRYKQLRGEGKSYNNAITQIRKELRKLKKLKAFGDCIAAKTDPYRLSFNAIEKIIFAASKRRSPE